MRPNALPRSGWLSDSVAVTSMMVDTLKKCRCPDDNVKRYQVRRHHDPENHTRQLQAALAIVNVIFLRLWTLSRKPLPQMKNCASLLWKLHTGCLLSDPFRGVPFKVYMNLSLSPFRYSLPLVFPLLRPHSPHARKICCTSHGRWVLSFDADDTDTCLCSRDDISQFAPLVYATSPSLDSEFFSPSVPPRAFRLPSLLLPPLSYGSPIPFPFACPVQSFTVLLPLFSPLFLPPATLHPPGSCFSLALCLFVH